METKQETIINTLDKNIFTTAYDATSLVINKRGIQPLLSNVLLTSHDNINSLNFSASDFDTKASVYVQCDIKENIKALIPYGHKIKEASNFKLNDKSLQLIDKDNTIQSINIMNDIDNEYPVFEDNQVINTICIDTKAFINGLEHLINFASKYDLNNILGGINLSVQENRLKLAATDGNCLSYVDLGITDIEALDITLRLSEVKNFIKGYKKLSKYLDSTIAFRTFEGNYLNYEITLFGQNIVFKFSGTKLDGTYPRYMQLCNRDSHNKFITMDFKEFKKANANSFKSSNPITHLVELSVNGLKTSYEDNQAIEVLSIIESENFEDFKIYYSAKLMQAVLTGISTYKPKNIGIWCHGALNPMYLLIDNIHVVSLLMPIKHDMQA